MTAPVSAAELARRAVITARLTGRSTSDLINSTRDLGSITAREADAIQQAVSTLKGL